MNKFKLLIPATGTLLFIFYHLLNSSKEVDNVTIDRSKSMHEQRIDDAKSLLTFEIIEKCRALPTHALMDSDPMKSAINMLSELNEENSGRIIFAKNIRSSITCRKKPSLTNDLGADIKPSWR